MPAKRAGKPAKRTGKPTPRPRKPEPARRPGPKTSGAGAGPWSGASGDSAAADALIAALPDPRRTEVARVDRFVRETLPGLPRHAWSGMVGYGPLHYRYASGREGDTFKIALASRAAYLSLYTCAADARGHVAERYRARLPRADIGKGCVRFKRLDDLDPQVLRELLREAAATGYGV